MRSTRTASTETATTTVSLPAPTGRTAGDVLVASFTADKNPTATVPAGWTAITNGLNIGSGARVFAYYRVAGSSDPATYTWTLSTAVKWGGGISAYTGVNTSTPLDSTVATAVNATFSATSIAVPGVSTASNGALLIGGLGFDSSTPGATAPTGWTERWETSRRPGRRTGRPDPAHRRRHRHRDLDLQLRQGRRRLAHRPETGRDGHPAPARAHRTGRLVHGLPDHRHGPADRELHRHLHRQPDLLGLGVRRRRHRHRAEPLPCL